MDLQTFSKSAESQSAMNFNREINVFSLSLHIKHHSN